MSRILLPSKGPQKYTRIIQTNTPMHLSRKQTHRMSSSFTWSPILVYVQTVAPSSILSGFLLVNVFVFSPAVLCVFYTSGWVCVSGEADGQVPPVVKCLLSLHTLSHAHFPKLPASFHLRHCPLVPPGELSLSVHFTQDWCHSQSCHFQWSFVSFLWFHVHDDIRQIIRYGEPKLAFGHFKIHLKIHELCFI